MEKRIKTEKPANEKRKRKIKVAVAISVMAVALCALVAADAVCGYYSRIITLHLCGSGISFDGDDFKDTSVLTDEFCQNVVGDSCVLLKNDGVLPMRNVSKVNLFGWGSTDFLLTGVGSGAARVADANRVSLTDALTDEGIQYNEELYKDYVRYCNFGLEYSGNYDKQAKVMETLVEPGAEFYTEDRISAAKQFSDVALVVLRRKSGEKTNNNNPNMEEIPDYQKKHGGLPTDKTRTYLEISTEEAAMLDVVTANFDKVIVLLNTCNNMHCGFLQNEKINAALYVGVTGQSGARAVAKILKGDINPSGKLTDTWIYEPEFEPSYANFRRAGNHIQYVEDIYIGYKFYETADVEGFYADTVTEYGRGYDGAVQYPFGFGLSYTDFEWSVTDTSLPSGSELKAKTEIELTLSVKNVGEVAGKDVVELYYTPPYYKGTKDKPGIEKAHVNLCDFAKTELLEPGQTQENIKLKVSAFEMASYDCYDRNGNDFCGYELEHGVYALKLMTDAHTLATCENAVLEYNVPNDIKIKRDPDTKKSIKNRFTGDNAYAGVPIDGSTVGANMQYLSRADFAGTFPSTRAGAPSDSDPLVRQANGYVNTTYDTTSMPTTGKESDLRLIVREDGKFASKSALDGDGTPLAFNDDLLLKLGASYSAPEWDMLLDQMSANELCDLVEMGGYRTVAVESIGKTLNNDCDGPAGLNASIMQGNTQTAWAAYPGEALIGCGWNKDMLFTMGLLMGKEANATGISGWYAPCVNLHRSAYNTRNFEAYAEDGVLSGKLAANIILGAKANGLYCYLKHFALSESGHNPRNLNTWLTEQNLRENYLRPFEICVKEGEANAIMTAFNRVGGTWAGASYPLLTNILRSEWGFKGSVITDWSTGDSYMNPEQGVRAGNDLWLNPNAQSGMPLSRSDATDVSCARTSAKRILYTYADTYHFAKTNTLEIAPELATELKVTTNDKVFAWWILLLVFINLSVAGVIVWRAVRLFVPKKAEAASGGGEVFEQIERPNEPEQMSEAEIKADDAKTRVELEETDGQNIEQTYELAHEPEKPREKAVGVTELSAALAEMTALINEFDALRARMEEMAKYVGQLKEKEDKKLEAAKRRRKNAENNAAKRQTTKAEIASLKKDVSELRSLIDGIK